MSKTPKVVRFYFDFISPYSYLGWVELQKLAKNPPVPIEIKPIPILFDELRTHWGSTEVSRVPPKRTFVFKDVIRRAKQIGLDVQLPAIHPFNPVLPLCLITCLSESPRLSSVITAFFEACWGQSLDITDEQTLGPILWAHGFNDGNNRVIDACTQSQSEERLLQQTRDAIELGVFGVPTYHVDDELFWGSDQIDFLRSYLVGEDPLQKDG